MHLSCHDIASIGRLKDLLTEVLPANIPFLLGASYFSDNFDNILVLRLQSANRNFIDDSGDEIVIEVVNREFVWYTLECT
jgi:hypothetical protein